MHRRCRPLPPSNSQPYEQLVPPSHLDGQVQSSFEAPITPSRESMSIILHGGVLDFCPRRRDGFGLVACADPRSTRMTFLARVAALSSLSRDGKIQVRVQPRQAKHGTGSSDVRHGQPGQIPHAPVGISTKPKLAMATCERRPQCLDANVDCVSRQKLDTESVGLSEGALGQTFSWLRNLKRPRAKS